MKLTLVLLVFSSLLGCAHSDPWTKNDTLRQAGVTAVLVADAVTTSRMQYNPNVYNSGPLVSSVLGPNPSTSSTYQYFGSLIVVNYFITRAMPAKWRPYWQGWEMAVHGYSVGRNCRLDLC